MRKRTGENDSTFWDKTSTSYRKFIDKFLKVISLPMMTSSLTLALFIFYLFNAGSRNIQLKVYRKNSFFIKENVNSGQQEIDKILDHLQVKNLELRAVLAIDNRC